METQPSSTTTASPLAQETDADLLVYMSMAAQDGQSARQAWEAFYLRHVRYLYAVCVRAYGPLLGGNEGAADLVADTFKRAYEHADTFDADGIIDPDRLRLRARAWLGRIAQRLAQDHLRGRGQLPACTLDGPQWQQIGASAPSDEQQPTSTNAEVELVREAIRQALNEREQIVIRLTFQWYQPDARHQRLSNAVCADLAERLGTTSENLRQIRRRALKKVETYLRQHGLGASPSQRPGGAAGAHASTPLSRYSGRG